MCKYIYSRITSKCLVFVKNIKESSKDDTLKMYLHFFTLFLPIYPS